MSTRVYSTYTVIVFVEVQIGVRCAYKYFLSHACAMGVHRAGRWELARRPGPSLESRVCETTSNDARDKFI